MKIKIIFILLFIISNLAFADSFNLSGQTLEKGTRKPISGVYVVVREDETLTAISDEQGRFELALPKVGRYTLTAATLGGGAPVNLLIDVKAGATLPSPTFYLPAATVLDEVVVRGERNQERVGKTIITGAELRRVAGSGGDPLKSLQALPGVVEAGGGQGGGEPAVRGSSPDDNLYYVDGLPIGKIFHNGGISIFNADLIQDFNLYSAAFAPRYGDATGAVIDVALREPRSDRMGGKLNVNLIGADFLLEGPLNENQSFYFAGRRSYIDLLLKNVSSSGVTVQIPNYTDYQGKYSWRLSPTDKLTFQAQGATDSLKLSVAPDSIIAQQQPILSGDLNFSDAYSMQAAVWDSSRWSGMQNKLALEHVAFQFQNSVASAGNLILQQDSQLLRELLKVTLNEQHELTFGANLDHSQTLINADIIKLTCTQFSAGCDLSAAKRQQLSETLYTSSWEFSAQDRARVMPKLTLTGGLHYTTENYLNQSYTEPRLGAEWDWNDTTLLTAGWGLHNQLPTGQQISHQFGNSNLSHLRAEHSVLGVSKKLENEWSWKTETYYKKLSNLVVGDPLLNYVNGGSGRAYGAELLIKKDGLSDLTGWLSLSLARSERQNDLTGESFRFQYDQPINSTLVLNYKLSEAWSMGTKWNFHSGTAYTPIIGATQDNTGRYIPTYAAVNSGTLPDYHRLDIRFDRVFVFNTWKLNTYFELNNLYFRENISGYRYDASYRTKEAVTPLVIPFSFGVQAEF
jgi:hypothetical protein